MYVLWRLEFGIRISKRNDILILIVDFVDCLRMYLLLHAAMGPRLIDFTGLFSDFCIKYFQKSILYHDYWRVFRVGFLMEYKNLSLNF